MSSEECDSTPLSEVRRCFITDKICNDVCMASMGKNCKILRSLEIMAESQQKLAEQVGSLIQQSWLK
jgi:hypothetical protein